VKGDAQRAREMLCEPDLEAIRRDVATAPPISDRAALIIIGAFAPKVATTPPGNDKGTG